MVCHGSGKKFVRMDFLYRCLVIYTLSRALKLESLGSLVFDQLKFRLKFREQWTLLKA